MREEQAGWSSKMMLEMKRKRDRKKTNAWDSALIDYTTKFQFQQHQAEKNQTNKKWQFLFFFLLKKRNRNDRHYVNKNVQKFQESKVKKKKGGGS